MDKENNVGDEGRSLSDPIDHALLDLNTPSLFSSIDNDGSDAVEIENLPNKLVSKPEAIYFEDNNTVSRRDCISYVK